MKAGCGKCGEQTFSPSSNPNLSPNPNPDTDWISATKPQDKYIS